MGRTKLHTVLQLHFDEASIQKHAFLCSGKKKKEILYQRLVQKKLCVRKQGILL